MFQPVMAVPPAQGIPTNPRDPRDPRLSHGGWILHLLVVRDLAKRHGICTCGPQQLRAVDQGGIRSRHLQCWAAGNSRWLHQWHALTFCGGFGTFTRRPNDQRQKTRPITRYMIKLFTVFFPSVFVTHS